MPRMGTHPSGPSTLNALTGPPLSALLEAHPELMGAAASLGEPGTLPFLFKVLSIGGALSIQSHPDKALAERLHASQPEHYRDDNHKPEMLVALTACEALCGFAPPHEAGRALAATPELRRVCGERESAAYLKALEAGDAAACAAGLERLTPGDVGVLAALLLNHLRLAPGDALALEANVPHAYLSGQALEAMAASDNVIRAGLTPKFRDARTLCASLRYEQRVPARTPPEELAKGAGVSLRRYRPPFPEFEVFLASAAPGATVRLDAAAGPTLLLVLEGAAAAGRATEVARGQVFFLGAGHAVELQALGDDTLVVAAVAVNGMGFGTH
ncbi:hypothetical protein QBZ16_005296 [Prototheca wickerhamii]|uniref:mannose-6-phosphate isomerase n=1 Tax=Prototheca wickerhamii TaxID=3111 RepID=A0AAD9IE28_PROWI|nr:hypothetical protein QBZ16_005296 [Prototheca wickerhamii]